MLLINLKFLINFHLRKWNLLATKQKLLLFKENPLGFFIPFFVCFHFFTNDFHHCFFRVFSFLIAFVHVTNFLYHDCVFAAFLSGTLFLCCCKASATDLREHFLRFVDFYLPLLPNICHITRNTTDFRVLLYPF